MDKRTEITRLQERIIQLEREKEEVEGFAAVAAHELLTPVVMIDACAATMSERMREDDEAREELEVVRRGCARSRVLVESLLHRAAFRGRPLQPNDVELAGLVVDCLALLGPEIRSRGATVVVGPLPTVAGEAPLIGAVFMNLLVNALKYGPRRGGTIRIGAERADAMWRFGVESEGDVIAPADAERIFEPFRRGIGERRAPGCGLGLAICREIVERHGGEIGVEPGAAGGNRFHFTLPG